MTLTPTSPGVYITEIPSGSRTITGVATAVTAFIGPASRGPVDDPVPVNNFSDFQRAFGGLWRGSGLGYAVRDFYLNGGGPALIVRIVASDATTATIDVDGLELEATGPGAWANTLHATVSYVTDTDDADAIADGQGVDASDLFTLVITDGDAADAPAETFLNVTVVDGPRRVDRVLASSQLVRVTNTLPDENLSRPGEGTYDVGTDATDGAAPPTIGSYASSALEGSKRGMYALTKADLFNIVCIPPTTPGGDVDDNLWALAAAFCFDHRAFLIVDPPGTLTADDAEGWPASIGLNGPTTRNAALYFPRVRKSDPLRGGASDIFAASGVIAGTMARTDGSRGVWKAPAGTDAGLVGVTDLSIPIDEGENGALNQRGINCLRTFRVIGPVIWGSRTLRGADILSDDYKYVPVRRLALFLEESLYRGTQWAVFEPNDAPLWGQLRTSVGAFMQDLFTRGAFQGTTPRDAYFVRCDAETTTQYDIDRGIVNIQVGFAPLKPAEFVMITIQQKTISAE
jgi:phage tail sheath protein FI